MASLLLAVPPGILIGLTLGALGGGGSVLTIPVLVYLLGQPPKQAATVSLMLVAITGLVGAFAHRRAGRVRLAAGLTFGALATAGSYLGSCLSAAADPHVLMLAFACLMIAAAAAMLLRRRHTAGGTHTPHGPEETAAADPATLATDSSRSPLATLARPKPGKLTWQRPRLATLKIPVAATLVGMLTGFFGVGGGFVVVPVLVLALGFDVATAAGTSLVVIVCTSGTALATRLGTLPSLNWLLLGVFTAAAITGVILGKYLADRVNPHRITTGFATLLALIGAYTAATTLASMP